MMMNEYDDDDDAKENTKIENDTAVWTPEVTF